MKTILEGLFKKNPVFILALGIVPAVAITSTALNGWVLGLVTATVFLVATFLNQLLTSLLPEGAGSVLQGVVLIVLVVLAYSMLLALNPAWVGSLGVFLPLIAANSMVLTTSAKEQSLSQALLSSVGQGLGFTLALVGVGVIREFLGFGTVFGKELLAGSLPPLSLASSVPGGLIIVGLLMALLNKVTKQGGELHE